MRDLAEVSALASRVQIATPIPPITGRHLLSPLSFTHDPLGIPFGPLTLAGEIVGLTLFHSNNTSGLDLA
jgi:hypothetical protein